MRILFSISIILMMPLLAFGEDGFLRTRAIAIEASNQQLSESLKKDDFSKASSEIENIIKLQKEAGIQELPDVSLSLIDSAHTSTELQHPDEALFLVRSALKISPQHPLVLAKAIPFFFSSGSEAWSNLLFRAFRETVKRPSSLLDLFSGLLLPVLWAATFGLLVAVAATLAVHLHEVVWWIARYTPKKMRPVMGPLVAVALLVTPLWFGPMWTLVTWTFVLLFSGPSRRWLAITVGLLVVAWGWAIPLRAQLARVLSDPQGQVLLRVLDGGYKVDDEVELVRLSESYGQNPVIWFALGQLSRRLGDYQTAEKALARVDRFEGKITPVLEERGLIQFLKGDAASARKTFEEVEANGVSDATFFFNFSRINFDLLDTEGSRKKLRRATEISSETTEYLSAREELVGKDAVGDVRPGRWFVFKWLLPNIYPLTDNHYPQSTALVGTMTPRQILWMGAILLVMGLIFPNTSVGKGAAHFRSEHVDQFLTALLRYVPGGTPILLDRGILGCFLVTATIMLLMPSLAWPNTESALVSAFSFLSGALAIGASLWWIVFVFIYEGKRR